MKLADLKNEIQKYQYFEDMDIIDVALASIIATRLQLGDPIWMILIGASSSGKSQILRPVALTDKEFIHKVDDLTDSTFLSGAKLKGGSASLLTRIGSLGIMVMSDLTVLASKPAEARAAILAQLRMVYDGEMTKQVGNESKPLHWKGYLGILAGSTPSIYSFFEEVADMGERFIYYRMKPYDSNKATRLSMDRPLYGKKLDDKLSDMYADYIKETVLGQKDDIENLQLSDESKERILAIASFAEKVRTVAHTDWKGETITKIPVPAMPMRVALQLTTMAKALTIMRKAEGAELGERDMHILDWCGYSLANEEKRACLSIMAKSDHDAFVTTQTIADKIGLDTGVVRNVLQNMASTGVLERSASGTLSWRIKSHEDWKLVRRIEEIKTTEVYAERDLTSEEVSNMNMSDEEVYRSAGF
jgi:hypothetical protein